MAVVARKGLSRRIQSTDPVLSRALDGVRDVVELLAADHDVISSSVTALVASAPIPPGASLVVYSGGPGQTLTLPPANALGVSTGAAVLVLNVASVAVTVVPSRGDTLNGLTSLSLAAGAPCLLSSDGVSKWLALVSGIGTGVTDGDKGDITVSGGGTTWTIDADVLAALLAKASAASDVDDIERRFRLLLKRHFLLFNDVPEGLENEVPIALATH